MKRKINSRLRSERLKWGLTQKELAPLLLIRHATQLSRVERGKRDPSVISVMASCVVFGQDIEHLFPGLQHRVHEQVVASAYRLYRKVDKDKTPTGLKKQRLLQAVATRSSRTCS